jgi:hypothetical protein
MKPPRPLAERDQTRPPNRTKAIASRTPRSLNSRSNSTFWIDESPAVLPGLLPLKEQPVAFNDRSTSWLVPPVLVPIFLALIAAAATVAQW